MIGIGEVTPMLKAGLAAAGFLLGTLGVAAGSALNAPLGLPGSAGAQPQATALAGGIVLSSKQLSGEDRPPPAVEAQAPASLPTLVARPTPRPTFVPKPYSAPAPPTTPSQAEEQQKLRAMETQIADADLKLHTIAYTPPAAGAATAPPPPAPAAVGPEPQPPDQIDMRSADQTDMTDQAGQAGPAGQ
jgi:hypothetical protein